MRFAVHVIVQRDSKRGDKEYRDANNRDALVPRPYSLKPEHSFIIIMKNQESRPVLTYPSLSNITVA